MKAACVWNLKRFVFCAAFQKKTQHALAATHSDNTAC